MAPLGPSDTDESAKIDPNSLPSEVRELWETMLRLDPSWRLDSWLKEKAEEEMKLVEINLGKEKMRLEQRLSRVKALAERLSKRGIKVDEVRWSDPHQTNLFDVFSSDSKQNGDTSEEETEEEEHPATTLLSYLPDDSGDDPLLAIVAQLILLIMDDAAANNHLPISLEEIGDDLEERGIHPDEVIEGIDWLLQNQHIVEVAEDLFSLE